MGSMVLRIRKNESKKLIINKSEQYDFEKDEKLMIIVVQEY